MNSVTVIQSYLFFGDVGFFVSTIERDSSAAVSPPPRFFETMVWEWDKTTKERGNLLLQFGRNSENRPYELHSLVCLGIAAAQPPKGNNAD